MFRSKSGPEASNLDHELDKLERDTTGRVLRFAGEQIKPRPEFVRELEVRLAGSAQPASKVSSQLVELDGQLTDIRSARRSEMLLESPRVRFAWVGIGLGVLVVAVLGLSMLYSNRLMPGSQPVIPQPTFPAGLASSVLVMQWNTTVSRYELRPVDPATGETAPDYAPVSISDNSDYLGPHTLSPDGRKVAAIESHAYSCYPFAGGRACMARADVLHLIDVAAWREVTATIPTWSNEYKGWVGSLSFSPDNARLAFTYHEWQKSNSFTDVLTLVDTQSGRTIAQKELGIKPSLVGFSQDSSRLVVYGQPWGASPGMTKPGPVRVVLLDAATLETLWEQTLEHIVSGNWCESNCQAEHSQQVHESWQLAVVFSHDRRKLYIVHADEEKLTAVDLEARRVNTVEIREARSWFEELLSLTADSAEAKALHNGVQRDAVLSRDGTKLYMVGRKVEAERDFAEALPLQVINVENGQIVASSEIGAFRIAMATDEARLFLNSNYEEQPGKWKSYWDVVDSQNLRRVKRIEDWEVIPTRRLDGQPILLANLWSWGRSTKSQFAVLDPRTVELAASWSVDDYATWVVSR